MAAFRCLLTETRSAAVSNKHLPPSPSCFDSKTFSLIRLSNEAGASRISLPSRLPPSSLRLRPPRRNFGSVVVHTQQHDSPKAPFAVFVQFFFDIKSQPISCRLSPRVQTKLFVHLCHFMVFVAPNCPLYLESNPSRHASNGHFAWQ